MPAEQHEEEHARLGHQRDRLAGRQVGEKRNALPPIQPMIGGQRDAGDQLAHGRVLAEAHGDLAEGSADDQQDQ